MFSIFKKDPIKKLEKEYAKKLEEGVHLQRNGNIAGFAKVSAEADKILKQIDKLKERQKK